MSETNWDDIEKLWSSFEIEITEEKGIKVAKFIFKDYESIVWTIRTFAKYKDGRMSSYLEYKILEMDKYVVGKPDPVHKGEDVEHWRDLDKDGIDFQLENKSVLVFPKIPAIIYNGYSFHHFFQHMFDWLPRELDNLLHSFENRDKPIATFKDGDLEIPVSREMINSGFMIHSQKEIDDVWDNSIKKWFIELNNDDRYKATEVEKNE